MLRPHLRTARFSERAPQKGKPPSGESQQCEETPTIHHDPVGPVAGETGGQRDLLDGGTAGLHPSAAYILRTQIEEADIVVVRKADLLAQDEADTLSIRGDAGSADEARMTLNARVEMPPGILEDAVRAALDETARGRITVTPTVWRSLSPGRPVPTHRYLHVVGQS